MEADFYMKDKYKLEHRRKHSGRFYSFLFHNLLICTHYSGIHISSRGYIFKRADDKLNNERKGTKKQLETKACIRLDVSL